jgi:hypothetical protein
VSGGYQVHPGQLADHIASVKQIADDCELARAAAEEISGSYDLAGFNLAYGYMCKEFGQYVHMVYDQALPLFVETAKAPAFLARQLKRARTSYERLEAETAASLDRIAGDTADISPEG